MSSSILSSRTGKVDRSGEDMGDVEVHGVSGGQSTEKRERDKIIVSSYY